MTLRKLAIVAGLIACGIAAGAQAQTYPTRPIRLIVPYAPGGTTDIVARIISEPLTRALGQPIVVENKAGAGGMVGTAEVARANPDGYTLGIGTVSTIVVLPATSPKLQYKPTDFTPISNIAATPNIIAVNPSFPAKNLQEFIAVLKANPDKYSFASSGKGSINHMMGESFQAGSGTRIAHVPYRGAGPAIQDVMAGNVAILVDNLPSSKPFIDGGKLRLMGVIAPKRVSDYPEVPTMVEAGLKGFDDQAWYGLVGPANLPAPVLARLAEAVKKALSEKPVRERLEKAGAQPIASSPNEYVTQIRVEIEKMKKLVVTRNISLDE
ncbi:Bug family tripartite tricarboxylate transporter substrate binding protein [Cupriavidus sp. 8B]